MNGLPLALGSVGLLALGSFRSEPSTGEGSFDRRTQAGLGLLLLAGAGGILYLNRARVRPVYWKMRDTVREQLPSEPPPMPEPVVPVAEEGLPAGVRQQSGVVWSPSALAFVRKMRALLDPRVKLEVTSVTRTPERQANAMLTKYAYAEKRRAGGGAAEIRKIYGSKADAFLSAKPYTKEVWAQVVRDLQARNLGFRSGHLMGTAIDLHTASLSSSEVQLLIDAAQRAGGKTLLENSPPHLHVGIPKVEEGIV